MRTRTRIVFCGGLGSPNQFGGELTKNKEIVKILHKYDYKISLIDTYRSRNNKWKLLLVITKLFINIISPSKRTFLFSTSFGNIYPIIKILSYFPIRLKIIYWTIGGVFADRVESGIFNRKYLRCVNYFIVEGDRMKRVLSRCGIENVFVKSNFKTITYLPKIQKKTDGRKYFYFLSRIRPEKGVDSILNCVKRLNENGYKDKFVVHFYGNIAPDYRLQFENQIDKLENVEYVGTLQLQDETNYDKLAEYHYMLFPTYWLGEGFPGVVIDAYIAGTPIIASDWNLNVEYIKNGESGIIVPVHDDNYLYSKMLDVIMDKYDCDTMSKKSQALASDFDTESVITRDFLSKIL